MPKFGKTSIDQLNTCHKDIQLILNELIKIYDFTVLEGVRTVARQQQLFKEGKSKLDGVKSKSNHQPRKDKEGNLVSFAADILPVAKGTNAFSGKESDNRRFYTMMGMVKAISAKLLEDKKITHKVRFGLDWDGDDTYADQTFDDLPHFELVEVI